jgi:hypothetical protein
LSALFFSLFGIGISIRDVTSCSSKLKLKKLTINTVLAKLAIKKIFSLEVYFVLDLCSCVLFNNNKEKTNETQKLTKSIGTGNTNDRWYLPYLAIIRLNSKKI